MTPYETIIEQQFERGKADALDLRERSYDMDGTGIIAEQFKIPAFDATKDYSNWPAGAPVREDDQVFKLIQPYNAANYTGTPSTLPALWSICHTKDPLSAKPYLAPNGTSGMYMSDECCIENGKVYKSIIDNNVYSPSEYANGWELVE